jgi:hypothetical protein
MSEQEHDAATRTRDDELWIAAKQAGANFWNSDNDGEAATQERIKAIGYMIAYIAAWHVPKDEAVAFCDAIATAAKDSLRSRMASLHSEVARDAEEAAADYWRIFRHPIIVSIGVFTLFWRIVRQVSRPRPLKSPGSYLGLFRPAGTRHPRVVSSAKDFHRVVNGRRNRLGWEFATMSTPTVAEVNDELDLVALRIDAARERPPPAVVDTAAAISAAVEWMVARLRADGQVNPMDAIAMVLAALPGANAVMVSRLIDRAFRRRWRFSKSASAWLRVASKVLSPGKSFHAREKRADPPRKMVATRYLQLLADGDMGRVSSATALG